MIKKGFTLIELLAVIVILAIIVRIAMPITIDTIEKAKQKSAIESANGIIYEAKKYYASKAVDEKVIFDFSEEVELKYTGKKPESGMIVIDADGNISAALKINGYCVCKKYIDKTPSIKNIENCTLDIND